MVARIKSFLFTNTSQGQTVAKNTIWLTAGTLSGRLLRALFLIIVARMLAPADWGAFTYLLSLSALLTVFIDFGINAIITRESSRDLAQQVRYFATGLGIKGTMIAALTLGTLLLGPHLITFPEVRALIPILVLIVIFDGIRDFGYLITRAWERMELEALVHVVTNVAIVACGAVALSISPTPWSVALGYAIGAGIGIIPAYWPLRGYLAQLRSAWTPSLIKPILTASWPYAMLSIMGALLLNTDTIMIGWFMNLEAVGMYGAVQRIALFLYLVPGPVAAAMFPSIAKAIENKAEFRRLNEQALGILTLAAVPLAIGGMVLAGPITAALYGTTYLSAAPAFVFLALAFVPYFYSTILGNAVFAASREKQLFTYVVLGVTGNIILNALLIPQLGITGAALGTAINQFIITGYLAYRVYGIAPFSFSLNGTLPRAVGAGLLMGTFVAVFDLLSPSVYLTVPIGAAVYAGALVLVGEPLFASFVRRARAELRKP